MIPEHFLKKPVKFSQDLSTGALDFTTSVGRNFGIEEVTLKSTVAITEIVTVSRDSKSGAVYDTDLAKATLKSERSFVFRPSGNCNFIAGDECRIQCTTANGVGIVSGELKLREM